MLVLIQLLEGSSEQVSWQPIRGIFRSSRIVFLDRLCIPQDDEDQSGMIAQSTCCRGSIWVLSMAFEKVFSFVVFRVQGLQPMCKKGFGGLDLALCRRPVLKRCPRATPSVLV